MTEVGKWWCSNSNLRRNGTNVIILSWKAIFRKKKKLWSCCLSLILVEKKMNWYL